MGCGVWEKRLRFPSFLPPTPYLLLPIFNIPATPVRGDHPTGRQHSPPLPLLKRSRPRTIRTGRLHPSRSFHLRPIHPVVSRGPYRLHAVGGLILGQASRLDAFSGYPSRTWLPCLCPWWNSRYTSGASTPVLSY